MHYVNASARGPRDIRLLLQLLRYRIATASAVEGRSTGDQGVGRFAIVTALAVS